MRTTSGGGDIIDNLNYAEIKEEGVKQEPESDNLPPLIENDVKSEVESDLQLVNVNSLGTKTESTQSKTIYDKYRI